MTLDEALAALRALVEPGRAEQMAAYHKQSRDVMGIPNPAKSFATMIQFSEILHLFVFAPSWIENGVASLWLGC